MPLFPFLGRWYVLLTDGFTQGSHRVVVERSRPKDPPQLLLNRNKLQGEASLAGLVVRSARPGQGPLGTARQQRGEEEGEGGGHA